MYTRVFGLPFVLLLTSGLALAACGDDSGDSCSNACTPGLQSTPGMVCDPCPQTNTSCAASGGTAATMCMPDGTWDVRPAPNGCFCIPGGGNTACGNNLIDTGEQCDGANLNGMSCATMMPGSTGTLTCNPGTCTLNTAMCVPGTPMGGMGGG